MHHRHRRVPAQRGPLTGTPLSPEAAELLDAAACGLAQTADDGTFLRVNRRFCQWIGATPDDLVGRRRFQDLLTAGGRIFHQTHWAPLLRMQGSVSEVKLELKIEGGVLPIVINAIRRAQGDEVVHELAIYVARDRDKYERELIKSRKQLEVLVAEANQHQAEARDRAVFAEQMIGIVSHDLRNPLATIAMASAILLHGGTSPAQQRMLAKIKRSTERATHLISDLLDFTQARLGTGLPVDRAPIDLRALVAEAVEDLRTLYPIRILEHHHSGDGCCTADAHRLHQMLGNLVANAVAYGAPATPVTIHSAFAPDSFTLSVHNHGDPIPPELQARMFQPMTRGTSDASASRSVGLGLFIVHEIARAHGGAPFVDSTAERGTTIGAVFPCT